MLSRVRWSGVVALAALALAAGGADAKPKAARVKGPRFYFELRGVRVPSGADATLKAKAREVLVAELKKQPLVVMELGDPAPAGAELEKELKARQLDGFGLVLRVTKADHALKPPAAGKVYKMLMVEVGVALDAEKLPSGQLALAGEGNSQVGTEVQKIKDKERKQLTIEALSDAIKQAVEKSILKLGSPAKPEKRPRKKRR
jgi:hypothetical protein